MSAPATTLQRIRFCAISPKAYENEAFFKTDFRLEPWERAGRSAYWCQARTADSVAEDPAGATLPADAVLDSDSYFNAFFAAYWRKLTTVANLGLRLRFVGKIEIRLQAHTITDEIRVLKQAVVHHPSESEWTCPLDAEEIPDSTLRLSFRVSAVGKTARLTGGDWYTTDAPARPVRVAVVMPTYNRAHFARQTVQTLLADSPVADLLERIVLIEQSDQAELADLAGEKCAYVRQPNLGGAGGFARGMHECVHEQTMGEVTHLLFLDDDIMIETDSVLRAVRLAAFGREPIVIGGGMLDLFKPDTAVALGEFNEPNEIGFYTLKQVYPKAPISSGVTMNLASLPQPVGYCAWWFCLFPVAVVREIGLPLPCFFRGDDVQWGTRARLAGFEPYLVPGIGLWHLPFQSKSLPWVTYFDRYNTLVANALHGPAAVERCFAYSLYEIKFLLLNRQHGYAAAAILALQHYLRGWPHYRDRVFPAAMTEVKRTLAAFASATPGTPASLASMKASVEQLERSFGLLTAAYSKQGARVQADFAAQMPKVYQRSAWAAYFTSGSMKALAGGCEAIEHATVAA